VHDLRHTTATVLLKAGVHPKLVQHLLGHSTIALTLNTYSHVTPGLSREAARAMDRLFGPDEALTSCQPRNPAPGLDVLSTGRSARMPKISPTAATPRGATML
jgi:hypothetical protein